MEKGTEIYLRHRERRERERGKISASAVFRLINMAPETNVLRNAKAGMKLEKKM